MCVCVDIHIICGFIYIYICVCVCVCRHTHNLWSQELFIQICEKACLKRKVLSWVLNSDRVGRFCRLASNEFQTDRALKLNEHLLKDFISWSVL